MSFKVHSYTIFCMKLSLINLTKSFAYFSSDRLLFCEVISIYIQWTYNLWVNSHALSSLCQNSISWYQCIIVCHVSQTNLYLLGAFNKHLMSILTCFKDSCFFFHPASTHYFHITVLETFYDFQIISSIFWSEENPTTRPWRQEISNSQTDFPVVVTNCFFCGNPHL